MFLSGLTLTELSFNELSFFIATLLTLSVHVIIIVHILMNKHEEPASAILWILVVFNFSVIGIVLYLIFGINRINTIGISVRASNEEVNAEKDGIGEKSSMGHYFRNQKQYIDTDPALSDATVDFNRTLDRLLPETLPLKGNSLELLNDGTMAYPVMLEEIKKAKKCIHLQSFIITDDEIGKKIFDALQKKAENGVKVKVLYDRFGSGKAIFSHFFQKYAGKTPNFSIKSFMRVNLLAPWRVQLRNHRKLLIVDGSVAFIGGINISNQNITPSDSTKYKYIHDLHCLVRGPAVGELQFSFIRDWCFASNTPPAKMISEENFPTVKAHGESKVRVIDSGPGQNPQASEKVFFTAASTAKKYLWIITPYFVPEKAFIKALYMSAARGVDVRIMVPLNNNHWYVDYACKSLYGTLLSAGVRIFEKKGNFSHIKAMIVDGQWTMMGSSNCDVRSFKLNFELDFISCGGRFIEDLHSQFKREFNDAGEVLLTDLRNKRFTRRLAENICSLLTPVL